MVGMEKRSALFALVAFLYCIVFPFIARAAHTLNPKEEQTVEAWLRRHSGFRQATDADCGCERDIQLMRTGSGGIWKPVPDYHPYLATGDFNGDGNRDLAVVVVDTAKRRHNFTLLVFNGPVDSADPTPTFVCSNLDLIGSGLFYGSPRPKPFRLVLGRFESEGRVLVPRGRTYRFADMNP
jgi:hypothetical protein